MQLPDAAVGSIVAAIIAGLVVFISTVLSKEQKTSEFRQVWIDELRQDIAKYISGSTEIATFYHLKKNETFDELKFLEENFELIHEMQTIEHRITLRLNPKEHFDFIKKFKSFRKDMIARYEQGGNNQLEAILTDALLVDAKKILKDEWERVKRGEPAFRFVKWAAVFVVAVIIIFLLIFFLFSLPPKPAMMTPKNTTKLEDFSTPAGSHQSVQVIIDNSQNEGRVVAKLPTSTKQFTQKDSPNGFPRKTKSDCQNTTSICKEIKP